MSETIKAENVKAGDVVALSFHTDIDDTYIEVAGEVKESAFGRLYVSPPTKYYAGFYYVHGANHVTLIRRPAPPVPTEPGVYRVKLVASSRRFIASLDRDGVWKFFSDYGNEWISFNPSMVGDFVKVEP